jgi:hypothetical protein
VLDGEPVSGASRPADTAGDTGDDGGYESMTKAELQAEAEAQGIETSSSMTKAELVEALGG